MATPPNQKQRAYSAAHFVLVLDQKHKAGFFRSVEGGGVKADILTYRLGHSPNPSAAGGDQGAPPAEVGHTLRQLGWPKYEDLKIQVGMSMSKPFYEWIAAFFRGELTRRNGAILAGDFHFKERARREFFDALISEISIPKLDAADRNACYMGVTLVPEKIRFAQGTGADLSPDDAGTQQKLWTPNNFELTIDGFEDACRRVTRIDGFTIKQQILEHRVGNLPERHALRVPGLIEFPNLTFSVPEPDAMPFAVQYNKHVVEGHPAPATRLTGHIKLLDHAGGDLCQIDLQGIDIAGVVPDKSDSSSQEIKQVRVEISCERMAFRYLGAANTPAA